MATCTWTAIWVHWKCTWDEGTVVTKRESQTGRQRESIIFRNQGCSEWCWEFNRIL